MPQNVRNRVVTGETAPSVHRQIVMNVNKSMEDVHKTLIKWKRRFFIFTWIVPFILAVSSIWINENHVIMAFAGFIVFVIIGSVVLYLYPCPNCGNSFFSSSYEGNRIKKHNFFSNKSCNHCGYGGLG